MEFYSLAHLVDDIVRRDLPVHLASERTEAAWALAYLAEFDYRKLYLPAAYPSMYQYCLGELRLPEDGAFKRIQAGRAARQFPEIFHMIADGRLHLTGVVLLAPHLTRDNASGLLHAAAYKTCAQIKLLLAERFPRPDLPTWIQPIGPAGGVHQLDSNPVGTEVGRLEQAPQQDSNPVGAEVGLLEQAPPASTVAAAQPASRQVALHAEPSRPKLEPIAQGRYDLHFTVGQEMRDLLAYIADLDGQAIPPEELEAILLPGMRERARTSERRRFAASTRPGRRRSAASGRYIPAEVRRAVWKRDGGQCTFVSECGRRCEARRHLEFDHIEPVARGGQSTVGGLRLRCRAHNQYEAERTFGVGFMELKRERAREHAAREKSRKATAGISASRASAHEGASRVTAPAKAPAAPASDPTPIEEVIPWLRKLGFGASDARKAAGLCASIPEAPLEERVRLAISSLAPPCVRRPAPIARSTA